MALSAGSQGAAKLVHFTLNVVASLVLIRALGPAGFGDYVFVISFAALFGLLAEFGLSKVALREMAREPDAGSAILGTAIVARLGLAVVAAVTAQAVLAVLGVAPSIRVAVAIASLVFVTDALLSVVAVFQVRMAMQYEALVTVVAQAIDTTIIVVLVASGAGLYALVASPVVSGAVGVALAVWLARSRFGATASFDAGRLPRLVSSALPVGLTVMLAVIYLKIDGVLLGVLSSPDQVGIYGSAYRPIEYLLLASAIVVNTLFPLLARWFAADRPRFDALYRRGSEALLVLVVPVPIFVALLAEPLVRALYGEAFASAAASLRILAVALVFMIVSAWQGFVLLAAGRQRVTLAYDAIGLGVNVALNVVLIVRFGHLGAASAALVTAVVVNLCSLASARWLVGVSMDPRRTARILGANALLGLVLIAVSAAGASVVVAAAVGAVAYPSVLFAAGVVRLGELKLLLPSRDVAARGLDPLEA
ncbi:MAG TPA: flippase [Candidatus Limnocylindria bacterium]|nr:flippase [Candidatus Limnocylindria bacterium]